MSAPIRLACICTQLLGGRTFSDRLLRVIKGEPSVTTEILFLDYPDYQSFAAPHLFRLSNALESAWIIFRKFRASSLVTLNFNGYVFQGYQLALFFWPAIKTTPTILALDETPATARRANKEWSKSGVLRLLMPWLLDLLGFRRIFGHIDFFLARTQRVKDSLVKDYGIPEDRIEVTYMPIDRPTLVQAEKEDEKEKKGRPRLLFVGGEFDRKGGGFLDVLFDDDLCSACELTIVSDDPKFRIFAGRDSVKIIERIPHDELIELMSQFDLLLFPSFRDALGLVICEAIACGLAVAARDCGAQRELVQNNVNGLLFPYHSTPGEWRQALIESMAIPGRIEEWKRQSEMIYQAKLTPIGFEKKVGRALQSLTQPGWSSP